MNKIKKIIRRVTIYGKNEEREKAFDWIDQNNYWLTFSGPKRKSKSRIDPERFMIIAEKDMTNDFEEF